MDETIKELKRIREEIGLMCQRVFMEAGLNRGEEWNALIRADVSLFEAINILEDKKNG